MSNKPFIPGPKPPPAPKKLNDITIEVSCEESESVARPYNFKQSHSSILGRPTSELAAETTDLAKDIGRDANEVGGLLIHLSIFLVLLIALPWSLIAAIIFGPKRVWQFCMWLCAEAFATIVVLILIVVLALVFVYFKYF